MTNFSTKHDGDSSAMSTGRQEIRTKYRRPGCKEGDQDDRRYRELKRGVRWDDVGEVAKPGERWAEGNDKDERDVYV